MSLDLGLQLFSVREELEKNFVGTLEKIAKIGYKNVELFIHDASKEMKIGGMEASELKNVLDGLGLNAVSMHVDPLSDEVLDEAIRYNLEIGSKSIGCGIGFYKNKKEVIDFSRSLNEYGRKCKENGLDFYYHNHFQEFQKFDEQYVLDILLKNTNEDLVKVEFDTYWALRGGVDPVAYLKNLGNRCINVHQKDLPSSVKPVSAFDVIGENREIDLKEFQRFSKPEYFTEPGEGVMEIKAIIETVRQIGAASYIFVEQDWSDKNQLASVEISYENITKLLDIQ